MHLKHLEKPVDCKEPKKQSTYQQQTRERTSKMECSKITRPNLRPVRLTRTLLVAHSDHYLLEHLVLGLEQSGFSVHNANSGINCVEKLRVIKPEVLLLDPDLLWGGGDGVLASMVSNPALVSIPVLLLVTFETNMNLANSMRTTVSDVLSLPTSKEAIADRCLELADTNVRPSRGLRDTDSFRSFPADY